MKRALLILMLFPLLLFAESPESFMDANRAYAEGSYAQAAAAYEELIANGHASGDIYYNLGSSYFKAGELGRAILNYERARLQIPRDADLNYNLNYARQQMEDDVEIADSWLSSITGRELLIIFCMVNLLFFGILILRRFSRPEWSWYAALIVGIFWLLAGGLGLWKLYQLESDSRAVILAAEATVMAGPDSMDTPLFKLHAGSIVETDRSEDGWSLIKLDERRGWLPNSSVEAIHE